MPLNDINKNAIAFKRLVGKAHTQQDFSAPSEGLSSNVQISLTTVFGEQINPNPVASGLTDYYDSDGIVEKVRFQVEIIPDTKLGGNTQGYRLKLPSDYSANNGKLSNFTDGKILADALGKLQIVPTLYGETRPDGTNDYEPKLYQTNGTTEIAKFDEINWQLDTYNGVLFVQNPPSDTSPLRPGFVDAYLYVGNYLNDASLGGGQSPLTAGKGIDDIKLTNDDLIEVNLESYVADGDINLTVSGETNSFIVTTESREGIRYPQDNRLFWDERSLVDKAYVDSLVGGLKPKKAVQVATSASDGNIDLVGGGFGGIIDTYSLIDGDRVLIKNQTDASENGIYVYESATSTFTRAIDFDAVPIGEVSTGSFTTVITGATNASTLWILISPNPVDVGVDDIVFSLFLNNLIIQGGSGITVNGTIVNLDGASIAGDGLSWDGTQLNNSFNIENVGNGENVFRDRTGNTYNIKRISGGTNVTVNTINDTIIINGAAGGSVIGAAEDGNYSDGLYKDFTTSTPIGTPIDRFNELFALLVPQPAPTLYNISGGGSFQDGKLSFGTSKNDIGYNNVTGVTGLNAVDINGSFLSNNNRLGLTQNAVSGVLNDDVIGNQKGVSIPFVDNAFSDGGVGIIQLEINGIVVNNLDLTITTGSTSETGGGTTISVSELKSVKFDNGNDFDVFQYRTGTFNIQTSAMVDGYNYVDIQHIGVAGNPVTNFVDWVYDSNTDTILFSNESIVSINLFGTKFISGVKYNTGGDIDYRITASNVYKNVYSDLSNAVTFPNRTNLLPTPASISITGNGITNGSTQALPNLRTDNLVTNPESEDITIDAKLTISNRIILGDDIIGSNSRIVHPFTSNNSNGVSDSGFLIYDINQTISLTFEDFVGEDYRMQAVDYPNIPNIYTELDSNLYLWVSSQNLISGDAQHSNGMLIFNGELMYPNSSYLGSEYGIGSGTTYGNFSALTNAPSGNVDYSGAANERVYYRKFRKINAGNLDKIEFFIDHSGNLTDFMTDGDNNGIPTGQEIKMEMTIIRANGDVFGWSNPFSVNNSINVTVSETAQTNTITSVRAQFSNGTPTIGQNDFVIIRLKFADTYNNVISNLGVTNF